MDIETLGAVALMPGPTVVKAAKKVVKRVPKPTARKAKAKVVKKKAPAKRKPVAKKAKAKKPAKKVAKVVNRLKFPDVTLVRMPKGALKAINAKAKRLDIGQGDAMREAVKRYLAAKT